MDNKTLQFKSYLERQDVQERIREAILLNRSQISVPISGVVSRFGFSENQLRKWEEKGLLSPQREGKHRHYSLQDLDKLAIIQELIEEAKYSPGAIPPDIDSIWQSTSQSNDQQSQLLKSNAVANLPINQRIENARGRLFWRYYVSHALRLSLLLIRESIPGVERTAIGLVLPLGRYVPSITNVDELPLLGEALVGWLAKSDSSHTLLTTTPSIDHPAQYSLYLLGSEADMPKDNSYLLISWQVKLSLNSCAIQTVRRLLAPIYENERLTYDCFSQGMNDALIPATDIDSNYVDYILDGLADMVIRLGLAKEQKQWQFCCILVSNDISLPLQQRSLIVRAQSSNSPYTVGKTSVSPNETSVGISIRAFQSGQIVYRPEICEEDLTVTLRGLENPGSAIAVPAGGGNRVPSAVLYIVSNEPHAFDKDDQRVLRLIGNLVDELLLIYRVERQVAENLMGMITRPEVVDTFFEKRKILSENEFVQDIEAFLKNIHAKMRERNAQTDEEITEGINRDTSSVNALTLISIDIDNQSQLANRYGDLFTSNLSKVVGAQLQRESLRIFTDAVEYRLYHICADRFYLAVNNLSLDEARKHAERIRRRLKDDYEVSSLIPMDEEARGGKQVVSVKVRLGVSFYPYKKLEDLLQRYSPATAAGNVRALINRDIDRALNKGRIEGGDIVISWDIAKRGLIRWPPTASS